MLDYSHSQIGLNSKGNNEGDDLDPDAAFLEHADGGGDVLHDAAELAVVLGVESFQVDHL